MVEVVEPKLALKLGKHYITRGGNNVRLVNGELGVSGTDFLGSNHCVYRSDGKHIDGSCSGNCDFDIVSEVPPTEISLEIGKYYRTRSGRIVKVTRAFSNKDLPHGFQSDHFMIYVGNGKIAYRDGRNFLNVHDEDPCDIVTETTVPGSGIRNILQSMINSQPELVPVAIGTNAIEINIQPRDKPLTIVVRQHGLPVEINLTFGVGA